MKNQIDDYSTGEYEGRAKGQKTFAGSSVLKVTIYRLSLSFVTVNEESLGFGQLVGIKRQPEDVALGFF